jgi:hypothetical protein
LLTAVCGIVGTGVVVGWAYEGPRRFAHRLKLRKAIFRRTGREAFQKVGD